MTLPSGVPALWHYHPAPISAQIHDRDHTSALGMQWLVTQRVNNPTFAHATPNARETVVPEIGISAPGVQHTNTHRAEVFYCIFTNMGVCPKTAPLIHRSTVIYTQNVSMLNSPKQMHCYSIK